jgi:hypothetical protein
MTRIDKTFTATLIRSQSPGGWTCVVTDWSAEFFVTRRLVKVAGTTDGHRFDELEQPLTLSLDESLLERAEERRIETLSAVLCGTDEHGQVVERHAGAECSRPDGTRIPSV